jgi:indolepyruvate ferredoxin oxidoreductase
MPEPRTAAQTLEAVQKDRSRRLVEYHSASYAQRYEALVDSVRLIDERSGVGSLELTTEVARSYYKLLAIKDEYEVARQLTSTEFRQELAATFEGRYSVEFHLAPPLWARRDQRTGEPLKRRYGAWLAWPMRLLARMRRLRGTALDVFAWTQERRAERRLIEEFEQLVQTVCARLQPTNYATAVQLFALTDRIRGFGHIKLANMQAVAAERERLLARFP